MCGNLVFKGYLAKLLPIINERTLKSSSVDISWLGPVRLVWLGILYVDELIDKLEHSGYGCKIGNKYYSILIYADDIFLLFPSAYSLQKMLTMCSSFSN